MISSSRIPLTIITGFLGAGKTTLLNHILHGQHGQRIAVLVNDFGAVNIDARLIVGVQGEMVSLANGCICCTIQGDLLAAVENLLNQAEPPEYLIVETSGVSDPAQIVLTFARSALQHKVWIDGILTVVDAEQFLSLSGQQKTLAQGQVKAGDIIILNKTDLIQEAELETIRHWIRGFVPQARILETSFAQVPLEIMTSINLDRTKNLPSGSDLDIHVHAVNDDHHDHDHSLVFNTWYWQSNNPVKLSALRQVLEELPLTIFRAKGVVYLNEMPDKKSVVQVVGKRISLTLGDDWGDVQPFNEIVVIGEEGSLDTIVLQTQFDNCKVGAVAAPEAAQWVGNVLRWLRVKKP